MPHIPVPAAELNTRLDRLRCAMTEKDPAWSMLLLDTRSGYAVRPPLV